MLMRFESIAAIVLGVALPVLETIRRGFDHWSVNFTTMFEDYVAGIALLIAALGVWLDTRWGRAWMVISWSGVTFMMLASSVSQVEKQFRADLEPHSGVVLLIKLLLLLASGYALLRSVQAWPRPAEDSRPA